MKDIKVLSTLNISMWLAKSRATCLSTIMSRKNRTYPVITCNLIHYEIIPNLNWKPQIAFS